MNRLCAPGQVRDVVAALSKGPRLAVGRHDREGDGNAADKIAGELLARRSAA